MTKPKTPTKTPVYWMFADALTQEAVRVFILHLAHPSQNQPPTLEQLEKLKIYLSNWLTCFDGLDSLKERVPVAQTVTELNKIIRVMEAAGADPL
jgi:hypothetical protein